MPKSNFRLSKKTLLVEIKDIREKVNTLFAMTKDELHKKFQEMYPQSLEPKDKDLSREFMIRRMVMSSLWRIDAIFDLNS